MRAPSKARIDQWVQIPSGQGQATRPELNSPFDEVTNQMKREGWMYQATMQKCVNVLSLEIFDIAGVDTFHTEGRLYRCNVKARKQRPVGVLGSCMVQDGKYVNLGDPLGSLNKSTLKQVWKD